MQADVDPRNRRLLILVALIVIGCLVVAAAYVVHRRLDGSSAAGTPGGAHAPGTPSGKISGVSAGSFTAGTAVCGQPVLRSPYSYDGAAGSYASGKAGLPTYGTPNSRFPRDTAGLVLPAGTASYYSYQLKPDTVYYLLPGTHVGSFMANTGDTFVGGYAHGQASVLSGDYSGKPWAIDSNSADGNQTGVTVEYLTIEKFQPPGNGAAINQDSNTGWTIADDTVTLNAPGAGAIVGSDGVLKDSCLTLNGQYGFQSEDSDQWGQDSLTAGPYDVRVTGNELSYNDTCDFEGTVTNKALGWNKINPVPAHYRNPHCGSVTPDGDEGGFKLWHTNGVLIQDNYIHSNWGPGAWADTDNANTTYAGNTFVSNDGEAIIEEISYNFSITGNSIADNTRMAGLGNPGFPNPAIYISESGSDRTFGGVPACPEASCAGLPSYRQTSVISGNTLINNGAGNIFLWQNSGRYCTDGSDSACTLLAGGARGPFTLTSCKSHLPSSKVSTSTFTGQKTGSPAENWWAGCMWRSENVSITHNVIDFNPAQIQDCTTADWPDCGAGGVFSEYGSPPDNEPGWAVPTALTFYQNDHWSDNVYNGPSTFFAWNQGNGDNPVSWANWTGALSKGDDCSSGSERSSGFCTGPFGQDAGSQYSSTPSFTPPSLAPKTS